jgi:hypothetical protein
MRRVASPLTRFRVTGPTVFVQVKLNGLPTAIPLKDESVISGDAKLEATQCPRSTRIELKSISKVSRRRGE